MNRDVNLIPEVYYPPCPSDEEDDEEADDRSKEELGREQKEPDAASLVHQVFIPMSELTLERLPENLRSDENLQLIQEMGKRVVLIRTHKLSEQRPESGQVASSLKGWGILFTLKKILGRRVAVVVTTSRVLFNEDEVKRSFVEVCLDPPIREGKGQGCRGTMSGRGMAMMTGNHNDDLRVAVYVLDDSTDSKDEVEDMEPYEFRQLSTNGSKERKDSEGSSLKFVCIIALHDDNAKMVSFGTVLSEDIEGKSITHDAPILPAFCGAPMLVFSDGPSTSTSSNFWYHVDHKTGRLLLPGIFASVPNLGAGDFGQTVASTPVSESEKEGLQSFIQQFQEDLLRMTAAAAVDGDCLAAFLPVFAAFLLRPEAYIKSKQALQTRNPCSGFLIDTDTWTTREEADMRKILQEISAAMPVLLTPSSLEEATDFTSLITSRYPCHCRTIVRAVMEEGSGGSADVGLFLRPDVASRKVRPWPWSALVSRDGSHDAGDLSSCLTEACLENCRLHSDRRLPLLLLIMIKNANEALHKKFPLSPVDHDKNAPGANDFGAGADEILYVRNPPKSELANTATGDTEHSQKNFEVARLLKNATTLIEADTKWLMTGSLVTILQQTASQCPLTIPIINFAFGLDRMGHIVQHNAPEQQATKLCPGSKTSQQLCKCGRPSFVDLLKASESICHAFRELDGLRKGEYFPPASSKSSSQNHDSTLQAERAGLSRNEAVTACLERAAEALASADVPTSESRPPPGEVAAGVEAFMQRLDKLENFSQARDVLSRGATSCEAFLYNCCQFLRQCRVDIHPLWVATPVTVFGRPGNWPGHTTPAELGDTAWKMVERAFQLSEFGRQRLDFLRIHGQSRSQLVDLYVDMKQHKFADQLDSKYFQVRVLKQLVKKQEQWSESGLQCDQPRESISCHMVLSFAGILNYPKF